MLTLKNQVGQKGLCECLYALRPPRWVFSCLNENSQHGQEKDPYKMNILIKEHQNLKHLKNEFYRFNKLFFFWGLKVCWDLIRVKWEGALWQRGLS